MSDVMLTLLVAAGSILTGAVVGWLDSNRIYGRNRGRNDDA